MRRHFFQQPALQRTIWLDNVTDPVIDATQRPLPRINEKLAPTLARDTIERTRVTVFILRSYFFLLDEFFF